MASIESGSLSNHNSIIRTFDYSIIEPFPAYTNVVTNLCATAIRPAETSVFLRVHWPVGVTNEASSLEVYASTNLLTNAWCFVGAAALPTNVNGMTIELPYASLPFGWSPIMFFILGLDEDSDNDGLSGLYERLVTGTDPADADSDDDGLLDGEELTQGTDPNVADSDGDGLPDGYELTTLGSDPLNFDTDGDGLDDGFEVATRTSCTNCDTDGDGMDDGWELSNFLDPLLASDANGDLDNDGATNLVEYRFGTNPRYKDSDSDGLSDGDEITRGTNPLKADTDGDGFDDKYEVDHGLDPTNVDTDRDGMPDYWEFSYCLDPKRSDGVYASDYDIDGDGLSNLDEYLNGTDPFTADTDGDGVNDGSEVGSGANPTDASDAGVAPAAENFRELTFNINGDYAAWEMTITGLGPDDTRTRRISMGAPSAAAMTALKMRKGNSYRLSMRWLNSDGHTDPYWYCWQAQIDGKPSARSYQDYETARLPGNEVVVGNGWVAENEDGLLTSHVHMHDSDEDGRGGGNVAGGLTATLYVYDCDVTICTPNDESWGELEESRVVLDDEDLRVRVRIKPTIETLDLCKQALGDKILVKTAGTCPAGAEVSLDEATFVTTGGMSELRFSLSRERVKALGLLPANDEDGVNEMASVDIVQTEGQSLADSEAFMGLGYTSRGKATLDAAKTLDSTPPNSRPSDSFFKAAGCEIVTAEFGGATSSRRQIMNQADYFYFSGHGEHYSNVIHNGDGNNGVGPSTVKDYWGRDLDCVIIAGCSVLDINDYNNIFPGESHTLSPGKAWEQTGPRRLLGYAAQAPGDAGGAPTRIIQSWIAKRAALGDIEAWMQANKENHAWNACAIEKGERYVYFYRGLKGLYKKKAEVKMEDW